MGTLYWWFTLGAILGVQKCIGKVSFLKDSLLLIGCVVLFYSVLLLGRKVPLIHDLQVVSLAPLMGVTFYFYKMCNSDQLKTLYLIISVKGYHL